MWGSCMSTSALQRLTGILAFRQLELQRQIEPLMEALFLVGRGLIHSDSWITAAKLRADQLTKATTHRTGLLEDDFLQIS